MATSQKQKKMNPKLPEEIRISPPRNEKSFDPYAVLKAPLSTEKCIRGIEFENKLAFLVDRKATKSEVKKAVEQLFNVKVATVNMQNQFRGGKKAYVRLGAGSVASDVSADLGLI